MHQLYAKMPLCLLGFSWERGLIYGISSSLRTEKVPLQEKLQDEFGGRLLFIRCARPLEKVKTLTVVLFADRIVVLSRYTECRFRNEGYDVVRIPPCLEALAVPSDIEREHARTRLGLPAAPLVVFPGDLEFGGGAKLMLHALRCLPSDIHLAMACRPKTTRALDVEKELRTWSETQLPRRVHWIGETPEIHKLLGCADVVALPSNDLFAKMDYPLVLLEAMSMERPVVVVQNTPAGELAEYGGATSVEFDPEALASRLRTLFDNPEERLLLGQAGRKAVLNHFSPCVVGRKYEELYEEFC